MKFSSLTLLLFCVAISAACDNEARYERYRKEDFAETFDRTIDEVSNFRGKNYMEDLPRGTMFLQYYQFESRIPVQIENGKTYKITETGKVLAFLEKKTLIDTKDLQLLKLNKNKLKVWESIKSAPGYDSGSNRLIKHTTTTTWIVYLPETIHRYYVVRIHVDKDV